MKHPIVYLSVFCWFLTVGCQKDSGISAGALKTDLLAVVLVSTSSVDIEATATGPRGAQYGIVYGTAPQPTLGGSFKQANTFQQPNNASLTTTFSINITQLTPNSRYYFRSYLKNGDEVAYGNEISIELKIESFWTSVGRAVVPLDYLPLPELLPDNAANSITLYFKSPNGTDLEGLSVKYNPSAFRGSWGAASNDAPIRLNYLRTFIEYGIGDQELFQGLGYAPNPSALSANRHYKDFRGEPGQLKRGRLPDYPGADVPTSFFQINQQIFILEKNAPYQLWRYDNESPKSGFVAKAALPVSNGTDFQAFVINNRVYVIAEGNPVKLFEYDLMAQQWISRANFPAEARQKGVAFVSNNRAFYGAGQEVGSAKGLKDVWEYNPTTNRWATYATYPGGGNVGMVATVVRGRTYLGLGYRVTPTAIGAPQYAPRYDFWEFKP